MAFPAERKLDHAFRRQILGGQHHFLVTYRDVVDLEAAGLDLAARFAVGGDQSGLVGKAVSAPRPLSSSARAISTVGSASAKVPS